MYCINPHCTQRVNPQGQKACQTCGTPLLIAGQYELVRPLREPHPYNPTEVFEVIDTVSGDRQVLKALRSQDPKLIELMDREAAILQLLNHPGIPRCDRDCFNVDLANGSRLHCLVIEKIEGQSLEDWLQVHGRLGQQEALAWLKELFLILDLIHQEQFFHRDLKPANIILKSDGSLAIIDFGAAREVSDTYLAKVSAGIRRSRNQLFDVTVVRSAGYAPLEQTNGKAVPQSDFYALGRTFAYLLTGIPLLELPEDPKSGKLIWRDRAPHVEKPVADFIDWLSETTPGNRPQNTQVVLDYLNHTLPRQLRLWRIRKSRLFKFGVASAGAFVIGLIGFNAAQFMFWYHVQMGLENQRQGYYPASIKNFERALKINPFSSDAHRSLALSCKLMAKNICAAEEYQKAIDLNPQSWEAYNGLANLYDTLGHYEAAAEQYRLAMKYNRDHTALATNNLARLKNRAGDFKAGAELAEQGLKQTDDPGQRATLLKNWGWAAYGLKQYSQAATHLQQSIKLEPDRADAYCLLAQVQEAQQQITKANSAWESCLRFESDNPEVRQWRSSVIKRIFQ